MAADSSKSGMANSPVKKPLQVLAGPAPTQLPWELTQVPRLSCYYTNQVLWGHHWDCVHNFMLGSPSETLLLPQRLPNARCPDTKKYPNTLAFGSVHFLSCVRIFVTPCIAACQASLSITNSQSLLKLMSIELVMPSNPLILCRPLLF